jgi:hypothetical protein
MRRCRMGAWDNRLKIGAVMDEIAREQGRGILRG